MLLTKEEREKFSTWLKNEAASDRAIITQMEKLPGMEAVAKRYKLEVVAAELIARKLDSIEDQTIE